jgi:hypothetical protein
MKPLKILPILLLTPLLPLNAAEEEKPTLDTQAAKAAVEQVRAVKPQEPRKVLIYSVAGGYAHDAIEYGKTVFPLLGERTGAFTAVVSDDPAMFDEDKLGEFDAVMFNNTSGNTLTGYSKGDFRRLDRKQRAEIEEKEKQRRENLLNFIREGGGFVGIHAATDTYKDWAPYTEMIGGKFAGHPWHSHMRVVVDVIHPEHPINEGLFPENKFTLTEEIYAHRDSQDNWVQPGRYQVLLQLNQEETKRKKNNINFVPISWISNYGAGRVYYNSLGHNPGIFEMRPILQHILRGIQWAIGDLQADATPPSR